MSETIVRHANVIFGAEVTVDDFVVLGCPPKGTASGQLSLHIGMGSVIRSHSVFYAGSRIGDRFQCGHGALVREECQIGNDCSVGTGSVLEFKVRMGNGVRVHSKCFIPEYSILEDGCWLGPNVVLTNAPYPTSKRAKETLEGVTIERKAIIGANSTILPGVRIGAAALVGAGSVVTKDVPPGALVFGNPARIVGFVKNLKYRDTGLSVYEESLI